MENSEYITLQEAAELLDNVSTRTVRRRIEEHGWDTRLDKGSKGQPVRKVSKQDVLNHIRANMSPVLLRELSEDNDMESRDTRAGVPANELATLSDNVTKHLQAIGNELAEIRKQEKRRRWFAIAVAFVMLCGVGVFALKMLQIARESLL